MLRQCKCYCCYWQKIEIFFDKMTSVILFALAGSTQGVNMLFLCCSCWARAHDCVLFSASFVASSMWCRHVVVMVGILSAFMSVIHYFGMSKHQHILFIITDDCLTPLRRRSCSRLCSFWAWFKPYISVKANTLFLGGELLPVVFQSNLPGSSSVNYI